MSDGEDASAGRHAAAHADGDRPWMTRTQQAPTVRLAPWERGPMRVARPAADGQWSPQNRNDSRIDIHGVTVAELIATVGAKSKLPMSDRPRRPQPARVREPGDHLRCKQLDTGARRGHRAAEAAAQSPVTGPVSSQRVGSVLANGTQPAPSRNRRRLMIVGRAVAVLLAVVALALTGGAYQWSASKNNRLNNIAALDPGSRDIVDANAQYGDENFLIVGVDSRAGANAGVGAGGTEDAGGARSDTVMLVNIPANRKRVVVVSFPRDLAITPMQCQAWDSNTGSYGRDEVYTETKLNSAYAFGGPRCLVKVIQKLSGLSINRFMAVDFAGFEKMVDAVGGIEVCSTTPLQDYELGAVLEGAGPQIVTGTTALNYVRARQVTTETNGDYGRIKRQQLFLSSLLRSLISGEVFFNLSKLNNVVNIFISDSFVDNVKTNNLVDLAQSLQNLVAGRITFLTVPTGETDAEGNEPLRVQDTRAIFDAIINDNPLPGENNNNQTTTPTAAGLAPQARTSAPPGQPSRSADAVELIEALTADPGQVTVKVSDSTGQTGMAAAAAEELQQQGFNVLSPDDYPSSVPSTTVFFSPGNEQAAATVASSLPNAQIVRQSAMGDVVQVVLGPGFDSVSPPPPSGSAVQVNITRDTSSAAMRLPEDLSITNAADNSCQ